MRQLPKAARTGNAPPTTTPDPAACRGMHRRAGDTPDNEIHTMPSPSPSEVPGLLSIPIALPPNSIRVRRDSILNRAIGSFQGVNSLGRFALLYGRLQSFRLIEADVHRQRLFFDADQAGNLDEVFDPVTLQPAHRGARVLAVVHDWNGLLEPPHDLYGTTAPLLDVEDSMWEELLFFAAGYRQRAPLHAISFTSRLVPLISQALGLGETTPLVLKKVTDGHGAEVTVLAGQSTLPQTVFNSVNVLIGVGLLALPLGIRLTGWVVGVPALLVCALSTYWLAGLLGRCMETDVTLMTYADLGYASFGPKGRLAISVLFLLDLTAACVLLVVLFSDCLNGLFPGHSGLFWKAVGFVVLTPFSFLSLPVLSLFSLAGISSTILVVVLVTLCGLSKAHAPGSLQEFATINAYWDNTTDLLVGIAILMAPFSGHAVFPNLKSDMRHPGRFQESLRITYAITIGADATMAVVGYLMFGTKVGNEVTNSVLATVGYPLFVYWTIGALILLVPFAKLPLNARPIVNVLEVVVGANGGWTTAVLKLLVNAAVVGIAVVLPEFDRIIGLMGASLCFMICLILPVGFYLRLCEVKRAEKMVCVAVIVASVVMAVVCTTAVVHSE